MPENLELRAQEQLSPDPSGRLRVQIDLAVYDRATREALAVIDTKYKVPDRPSNEDINQIVAYAKLLGCRDAVLVYPSHLPIRFDLPWGDIRTRAEAFDLTGDLEQAGQMLSERLLER